MHPRGHKGGEGTSLFRCLQPPPASIRKPGSSPRVPTFQIEALLRFRNFFDADHHRVTLRPSNFEVRSELQNVPRLGHDRAM
eukprot:2150134-Amphidinium_carterae.1